MKQICEVTFETDPFKHCQGGSSGCVGYYVRDYFSLLCLQLIYVTLKSHVFVGLVFSALSDNFDKNVDVKVLVMSCFPQEIPEKLYFTKSCF